MSKKLFKSLFCTALFAFSLTSCNFYGDITEDSECNHTLVFHNGKDSTCILKGTISYYQCSSCNKIFKDANANEEITKSLDLKLDLIDHNYIHHNAIESTCSTNGNVEYYECTMCHKYFSDQNGTKLENITAPLDLSAHQFVHHDAVESTCSTHGTIEYYECSWCHKCFSDQNGTEITNIELPLNNNKHNLIHHDAVEMNCSTAGNIEYYECSWCHKYFSDQGSTEIGKVTPSVNPNKHNYQPATYQFSNDFSTCTATCCCSYDTNHNHDIVETVQTSVEYVDGVNYYVASFSSYYFTKQRRIKSVDLTLTKLTGNTFEFELNPLVNHYKVIDDNDYKSDDDKTYFTSQILDKKVTYTADFVGQHNIQVLGYDSSENVIATSNVCSCEVEPIYYYQSFNDTYYLNRSDATALGISNELINNAAHESGEVGSDDEVLKFYINDNCNWTTNGNLKISKFSLDYFKLIKSTGANVVMFENMNGMIKVNDRNFQTSLVKTYLDQLYSIGMKAIISNERELIVYQMLDEITTYDEFMSHFNASLVSDFSSDTFLKACAHPATYGMFIGDEPRRERMPKLGHLVSWMKQFFVSKGLEFPHLYCDLLFYVPSLFDNSEQNYIDYLAKWVEIVGEDYFAFDMYTYTANGISNSDSSFIKTYTAINKYRKTNPNVKVHQTIVGNNANNGSLSQKDIYASLYLALSQGYYGLSWFSFNPVFSGNWINGLVKPTMSSGFTTSPHFNYITEANAQYSILKNALEGYSFKDCTITEEKQFLSSKYKKIMEANLTNGTSSIKMIVNYGTSDNVTNKVQISANREYWICKSSGINKLQTNSSSINVTLNNGEAVIIF